MFGSSSSSKGSTAPPSVPRTGQRMALALGWFSIGLGLAELLKPREVARATGLDQQDKLLQAYGAREVATGVAILSSRNPKPWIWGRVLGDVVDMATLSLGLFKGPQERRRAVGALVAVAGVTALDVACARALERDRTQARKTRVAAYSRRSGFPRPAEDMRGAAHTASAPQGAAGTAAPLQGAAPGITPLPSAPAGTAARAGQDALPQDERSQESLGHTGTNQSILSGGPHDTSKSFGTAL